MAACLALKQAVIEAWHRRRRGHVAVVRMLCWHAEMPSIIVTNNISMRGGRSMRRRLSHCAARQYQISARQQQAFPKETLAPRNVNAAVAAGRAARHLFTHYYKHDTNNVCLALPILR